MKNSRKTSLFKLMMAIKAKIWASDLKGLVNG
jgi:hypothetical protein